MIKALLIHIKPLFENELETFPFGHRFANDLLEVIRGAEA